MEPTIIRVTISLPRSVVAFADEIAAQKQKSRSHVIAEYLEAVRRHHEHDLLMEGYKALAEVNLAFAKSVEALDHEDWPAYKEGEP